MDDHTLDLSAGAAAVSATLASPLACDDMFDIFIVTRPVQTPPRWSSKVLAIDFLGQKLNAESAMLLAQPALTVRQLSASFLLQVLLLLRAGQSLPVYGVRKSDSLWTLVLMLPSYLQTAIELSLPSFGRPWPL